MKNVIRATCIGLLVPLIFCLFGCRTYIPGTEYSLTRDVMRKQNTWVDTGQSAAFYGDKIYYVSQENGQDGIHSMNKDGTDVQFICSAPKITRLIVSEKRLYYVGVKETYEGVKLFGLFSYDLESNITEEIPYTDSPSSVYDAYVTEDGTSYVLEMGNVSAPYVPRKLLYIYPKPDDLAASTVMTYDKDKSELWQNGEILYIYENAVSQDNDPDMEPDNFIDEGPFSFLNLSTGAALMDNLEEAYSERYFKVLLKQDDVIWCSMGNTLLEINADSAEVTGQYTFDDTVANMNLTYLYKEGNVAFVLFEEKNIDHQKKGDSLLLYQLNLEDASYAKIAEFDKEKVILHIGDGKMYWAEGKDIYCSTLDDKGIGAEIYKIEMPENIVNNNIFEPVGNWLLIYQNAKAAKTDTNRLLYKINLEIQAVIKVN